jgi:hypothetical protein
MAANEVKLAPSLTAKDTAALVSNESLGRTTAGFFAGSADFFAGLLQEVKKARLAAKKTHPERIKTPHVVLHISTSMQILGIPLKFYNMLKCNDNL